MSIGNTLADARRQAGLTVTQVSQQTRIRESIIRDIEQDDFSACGGDFYARGHIRSIATVLGIDPVPLITEFDAEHGPLTAMRAADVFEPSTPIKIRERRRSPSLAGIVVVVLLAIIGYSAYHLVSSHGKHNGTTASASRTPVATPTPSVKPSPTPTPTPSPTATPDDVVINLTAQEDCWVLITKNSDGAQLYMATIPAGTTMKWTYKESVSVALGNPGGITLTVNGQRQNPETTQPVTLNFSPKSGSSSSSSQSS